MTEIQTNLNKDSFAVLHNNQFVNPCTLIVIEDHLVIIYKLLRNYIKNLLHLLTTSGVLYKIP